MLYTQGLTLLKEKRYSLQFFLKEGLQCGFFPVNFVKCFEEIIP